MKNITTNKQSGAVSLFVVIFFMLLVTVVTVSFVRLMINDQQQASDTDLSHSAYDSAQAGVEDAKRAMLKYQQDCSNQPSQCANYANALTTNNCNAALGGIAGTGAGSTAEIKVQKTQSITDPDASLDQAYTCVTIKLQTDDYVGNAAANQSQLIPLIGASDFDHIKVEWFSKDDLTTATGSTPLDLLGASANQPLISTGDWPINRPSLMRAQLIQFSDSFKLSDFDTFTGTSPTQANAATMFLYPTKSSSASGEKSFTVSDTRKQTETGDPGQIEPTAVTCDTTLDVDQYACSAEIALPEAIGASSAGDRTAFLRLVPFYRATHFRITLSNGPFTATSSVIKFKDVQPEVDSTGRANDVFRRVLSRVNLYDTSFPYPDATIEVTGNFCKDFAVTNADYIKGTCKP